jgi:hypothetical protein
MQMMKPERFRLYRGRPYLLLLECYQCLSILVDFFAVSAQTFNHAIDGPCHQNCASTLLVKTTRDELITRPKNTALVPVVEIPYSGARQSDFGVLITFYV